MTHTYASSDYFTVTLTAANNCSEQSVEHAVLVNTEPVVYRFYLPIVLKSYAP